MTTSQQSRVVHKSYYTKELNWVSTKLATFEPEVLKPLITCYVTIRDFYQLLYDPKVNLADEIKDKFIKEIMLVDFGQVILDLKKYRGPDRDRAQSAAGTIDKAQTELYAAYTAASKNNDNAKVRSLKACRSKVEEAYLLLQYLDKKIEKYYKVR